MSGGGVKKLSQPVHSLDIPLSLIFKISVLKRYKNIKPVVLFGPLD